MNEYSEIMRSLGEAIEALRRDIPKRECPNGCGALEVAKGKANTNDGRTYFRVSVTYCPECLYIESADANL